MDGLRGSVDGLRKALMASSKAATACGKPPMDSGLTPTGCGKTPMASGMTSIASRPMSIARGGAPTSFERRQSFQASRRQAESAADGPWRAAEERRDSPIEHGEALNAVESRR